MSSVSQVIDAFELLYAGFRDPQFRKSMAFDKWSERQLLPAVRTFLLGYFGPRAKPEISATLPGKPSGFGRIDFLVYGIAVELAVRRPWCPKADILPKVNADEMRKLMKYPGRGVLVLFDFAKNGLSDDELSRYRTLPSIGRGPHAKSPFSVAYFGLEGEPRRLDIRVG